MFVLFVFAMLPNHHPTNHNTSRLTRIHPLNPQNAKHGAALLASLTEKVSEVIFFFFFLQNYDIIHHMTEMRKFLRGCLQTIRDKKS